MATVPAAKKAVHHLTAERPRAKPIRRAATAPGGIPAPAARQVDCAPGIAGTPQELPLVTYASPIPDEPGIGGGLGSPIAPGGAIIAPIAPGAVPTPGTEPVPTPVPEPATWLLLIGGIGLAGVALRRQRQGYALAGGLTARTAGGAALWSGSAAVEAGDVAATVAMKSTIASMAAKTALCVCPAAIVAGSVVGVPPIRHAVHAATATPTPSPLAVASISAPPPCLESVPVSTVAVEGFPATVRTVAATQASRPGAEPTSSVG